MSARKTWIWILVGLLAVGLGVLVAAAGAGVYFVSRHIETERVDPASAAQAFSTIAASLTDTSPLYELGADGRPTLTHSLSDRPTSALVPTTLWILAWKPAEAQLIRVSLPLWLVRLGPDRFHFGRGGARFDIRHFDLDVTQLERIGPALLFDLQDHDGGRVLVWTQ
jgi:hypothetical protein